VTAHDVPNGGTLASGTPAHRAGGALVVFEGSEGAGKSTQLRRLAAHLQATGVECVPLREPGGTIVGERVRALLLDPEHQLDAAAEALLFMASRAELMAREIRPAIARGAIVLLDRFFLSTYAYQIAGRGLDEERVRGANQLAVGGMVPDLTVVLDLPAEAGMARADARGARDRMEQAGDHFHRRVADAFRTFVTEAWQAAHPECGPIVRVDAAGTEDEVFQRVLHTIHGLRPALSGATHTTSL
jgi:dTMP kinase